MTKVDISSEPDFSFLPAERTCSCPPGRLNCLDREEILKLGSTVINVQRRHRWKESHPARFIPEVPRKFILLFSHRGETVLDPFCGSGTTNVEALKLGRNSIGIDVNPKSVRTAYERLVREVPPEPTHHRVVEGSVLDVLPLVGSEKVDLIVTSPPYLDVVDYGDDGPEQWGNIHDYGKFLDNMRRAFEAMWRALKSGGWMVVVTQDVFKKHAKCPIHADYIFICREIGFEVWSTQVYILNYSTGGRLVYGYPTSYYPKNDHEYILVFRKPEGPLSRTGLRSSAP